MPLQFHTYHDKAEVYISDPSEDEINRYRKDNEHSRQDYNSRRRNTYARAIIADLKENGFTYIAGLLVIGLFLALLFVGEMAFEQLCNAYHQVHGIAYCLN
ncbi:MAG TPA: hypothetical protein VKW08_00430 [Xanthobacteraceae bacterium]|nr:hypothetical protein [Xanthobacteraceae bacterium]